MSTTSNSDHPRPVVAILCADLHLSHRAPVARSAHDDWYGVMSGYLQQLSEISQHGRLPVIIAGDIFDDGWRAHGCPPTLINFALKYLPDNVYAVPGQHDLPHHRLEDLRKSAYWTLVKAGKITDIRPSRPIEVKGCAPIRLHGFPWGVPVKPLRNPHDMLLEIAVVHDYLWSRSKNTGYPGAPEGKLVKAHASNLVGYSVAVYGDNHVPLDFVRDELCVFNSGGFMRRKSDEVGHSPSVGLLHSDGKVTRHYLDVSSDLFLDAKSSDVDCKDRVDVDSLIQSLDNAKDGVVSFTEVLERMLEVEGISDGVREAVMAAIDVGR